MADHGDLGHVLDEIFEALSSSTRPSLLTCSPAWHQCGTDQGIRERTPEFPGPRRRGRRADRRHGVRQ